MANTATRSDPRNGPRWYLFKDGVPPDADEHAYHWNGRRWVRLDGDEPDTEGTLRF